MNNFEDADENETVEERASEPIPQRIDESERKWKKIEKTTETQNYDFSEQVDFHSFLSCYVPSDYFILLMNNAIKDITFNNAIKDITK